MAEGFSQKVDNSFIAGIIGGMQESVILLLNQGYLGMSIIIRSSDVKVRFP